MQRSVSLTIFLLLFVAALTAATPSKPKTRLLPTVTLQGTVINGVMTLGGDCPHEYWLKLATPDQQPAPLLGLETGTKGPDLAPFLNKQVDVTGQPGYCYGVEVTVPILHVKSIRAHALGAATTIVATPTIIRGSGCIEAGPEQCLILHDQKTKKTYSLTFTGTPPTVRMAITFEGTTNEKPVTICMADAAVQVTKWHQIRMHCPPGSPEKKLDAGTAQHP